MIKIDKAQSSSGGAGYISAILGEYRVDANTITAGAATGYVRYNNATQTSATEIYINEQSTTGVDITLFLELLAVGAAFVIQDKDDHANIQQFEITSAPVDNGTYWTIPVTFVSSAGTGTTGFANNMACFAAAFNPETDEKVKISANDTTEGYLGAKLVAGTGISLTENNDGSNETLTIDNTAPDQTVSISGDTNISVGGAYPSFNLSFTNGSGYLTAETDPVFTAWLATPPNVSIFTNDAGYAKLDSSNQPFVAGGFNSLNTSLRYVYDAAGVGAIAWDNRRLYDESGNPIMDWRSGQAWIADSTGVNSILYGTRTLSDASSITALDWANRQLFDTNIAVVDWNSGQYWMKDTYGVDSVLWNSRLLVDSSGINSVDWQGRQVINSGGSATFIWETLKFPTLTTNGFLKTQNSDGSIYVDSTTHYLENSPSDVTNTTYNTTSLVGQWDINGDTSTTAIDDSGNGRNGTYQGGLTQTDNANGIIGKYITLDGSNDYITVPHASAFNDLPLSICFSFRTTATPSSYTGLVEKYLTSSNNGWLIYLDTTGKLNGFYYVTGSRNIADGQLISTKAYNDGAWHRVVVIFNSSGGQLWVDGVQVDTANWTGAFGNCTTTELLKIGAHPSFSRYFNGSMDEILIYNKTMTSGEILSDYNTAMNAHYVEGRGMISMGHVSGWGTTTLRGTSIIAPDAVNLNIGVNTDNRGNSVLYGVSNTASIGNGTERAVALGISNNITGHRSLVCGVSNTASANNAIAVGYACTAGTSSLAMGNNTTASGVNAVSIGHSNSCAGAVAIGNSVTVGAVAAGIGIGQSISVTGTNCIAIGTGNTNINATNKFVIGASNAFTSGNATTLAFGANNNALGGGGTTVVGFSNTGYRTSSTSRAQIFGYANVVYGDSSIAIGRSIVSYLPNVGHYGIGSTYYTMDNTNNRYAIHQEATVTGFAVNRDTVIMDSASLGSELVLNADFSTGPFTSWDVGANWTWSYGNSRAEHTGASDTALKQTQFLTQGAVYELTLNTMTYSTGATFYFTCAGFTLPTIQFDLTSSTSTLVFRFVAVNGGGLFSSGSGLELHATGTFTIDNVSLKQVTGGKLTVLKELYVGNDTDSQDHKLTNTGNVLNENGLDLDTRIEGDTDQNLLMVDASADTVQVGSATTADSAKFYVNGKISTSGEMEINGALNHDGTTIGFFGAAPATQQTLAAYTSDGEGAAYTGIDNLQIGTVYATVADLNQLRVAYETLRASYDDLRTKLLATTLVN